PTATASIRRRTASIAPIATTRAPGTTGSPATIPTTCRTTGCRGRTCVIATATPTMAQNTATTRLGATRCGDIPPAIAAAAGDGAIPRPLHAIFMCCTALSQRRMWLLVSVLCNARALIELRSRQAASAAVGHWREFHDEEAHAECCGPGIGGRHLCSDNAAG